MPAKPLTQTQLDDAARLKRLFRAWQEDRKAAGLASSQAHCSESLGFGQSTINQYLMGKIPLNINAARKFAQLLEVSVEMFSPNLAAALDEIAQVVVIDAPRPARSTPAVGGETRASDADQLAIALQIVAAAIERTDDLTWTQGAALLRRLADEPERASEILARMGPLLGAQAGTQETARAAA